MLLNGRQADKANFVGLVLTVAGKTGCFFYRLKFVFYLSCLTLIFR